MLCIWISVVETFQTKAQLRNQNTVANLYQEAKKLFINNNKQLGKSRRVFITFNQIKKIPL